MNNKKMFGVAAFVVLMLAGFVSGAGVATPHWSDNPAKVYAGQEGEIVLQLQNMVGDQDLVFDVEYVDNPGEITSLDGDEYDVPAGSHEVPVTLSYSIPEGAQVGDEYKVRINFRSRSPDVEGGIETGVGMTRMIPFVVVPEPIQESPQEEVEEGGDYTFLLYLVVVLVVAGIVVYFVMRKKK